MNRIYTNEYKYINEYIYAKSMYTGEREIYGDVRN